VRPRSKVVGNGAGDLQGLSDLSRFRLARSEFLEQQCKSGFRCWQRKPTPPCAQGGETPARTNDKTKQSRGRRTRLIPEMTTVAYFDASNTTGNVVAL
jgi:hypothetical protein